MKAIAQSLGLIVLASAAAGCSSKPPMVAVTGVVTLNGKPVEHCKVCFFPEAEDANPEEHGYGLTFTDAEGRYSLANTVGESGIFPGRYKVVLVWYTDKNGKVLPPTAKPSETPGGFINQMPKEYEDPRTSPETVEIPKAGLTKDFAIVK
jgi:hypothetical protein